MRLRHWIAGGSFTWGQMLSLLAAIAIQSVCHGDESEEILRKVIESRGQIHNGSFTASGSEKLKHESGEEFELPTKVSCIFDSASRSVWFHRTGQIRMDIRSSATLTPEIAKEVESKTFQSDPLLRPLTATFVRNSEYQTNWFGIGGPGEKNRATVHVELFEPDAVGNKQFTDAFDVSSVGIAAIAEFKRELGIEAVLNECRTMSSIVSVNTRESGEIEVVFSGTNTRRTIRINPNQGFTCTRMEIAELDETGKPKSLPKSLSIASWHRMKDVWVPASVEFHEEYPDGSGRSCRYEFSWQEVNTPAIEKKQFTYKAIPDVWEPRMVIERRGGQRKSIDGFGIIALENLRTMQMRDGKGVSKNGLETASTVDEAIQKPRLWLILLNSAGAIVLLAYFLRRRHKNSDIRSND